MSDEEVSPPKRSKVLTDEQKAVIANNRKQALELRKSKLTSAEPITEIKSTSGRSVVKVSGLKFIDRGGGFLVEEEIINGGKVFENKEIPVVNDIHDLPISYQDCIECNDKFAVSYLWDNFEYPVCDACRDNEDKHSLITKTEAKDGYLLKDCDLDRREPILKFITRVNPHNSSWGEMKLYLHVQIEKRALEVWGSENNLVKEHELRNEKREQTKVKKYNKKMKQLRMDVRSSLYDKTTPASHTHSFGEETLVEDDTYTHTCSTCNFVETFEKM